MTAKVAKQVSAQIIEMLENADSKGWNPCWNAVNTMPTNAVTGNAYRGINVILLWGAMHTHGYQHSYWATFKQWQKIGCKVKKGSKGQIIVFWKMLEKERTNTDGSTTIDKIPLMRFSHVFNYDQVEGDFEISVAPVVNTDCRNADIDRMVAATGANIQHSGNVACYVPSLDTIRMPSFEQFHNATVYYSTLFHELGHWTGAKSRMNRDLSGRFGSYAYGMEELIAELTAAFTCAHTGLQSAPREDHAKYIKAWIEAIREDSTAIIRAASEAAKASEYIVNAGADEKAEAA